MRRHLAVLCLVLATFQLTAAARGKRSTTKSLCEVQTTCGQCIAAGPDCAWCTQGGYDDDNKARCDLKENLVASGCDAYNIEWPEHNTTYGSNYDVVDARGGNPAIQLQPQQMTVKLRPNSPLKFPVIFRQAENYPVDLYFVMDLSHSMKDDKKKLAELGTMLAANMSSITSNFRLGFGSFVDKKTLPYVSMVPSKLNEPCSGCVAPYGFKNHMPLTDAADTFKANVMAAPISGNLDAPEGGFDAIMQAIMCDDEVGWRDQSRKMLVYSTDAAFHFAGDGKLGGIVTPNDGLCHLDNEGYYSKSLAQDYPSVSQLSHKIAEKKVNIIWAVTQSQVEVYNRLAKFVEGSVVGKLANDSSNVVGLVQSNYEKISSTVELKTEGADGIKVSFKSKCAGPTLSETSKCEELGIGQNVTFEVEVEVNECPKDPNDWIKTFSIYPVGLTEALEVTLNLNCECECEGTLVELPNHENCNKSGTFECGACTCNDGFYGKNCECDGSNLDSTDYDAVCKKTNTSDVCEGHGQCMCGVCECAAINSGHPSQRYSGKFCECDDFSCDYYDNKICSGPEHGKCKCGECKCSPGFKGSACECPISEESCMAKNGLICNGKGKCECGKCVCTIDTFFRGTTCEDCPTCEGRCAQNKACVQCMAHQSGPYTPEYCAANCTHVIVESNIIDDPNLRKMCRYNDDDDCMFHFAYEYDSNRVIAQQTKECPEPVNVLAIVLGVVLGIVFVGLALLLIWKLLTTIQDRRELASFEKERKNAKWDTGENPIYKQATSTFKNPTYAGKS